MAGDQDVASELRRWLARLNSTWLEGRPQELAPYFHAAIVMVAPGFGTRISGREACVRSFEEFLAQARVSEFQESEFRCDVCGDTAVVSYRFDTVYRLGDADHREAGRELWVLQRSGAGWLAVWRTQFPLAAAMTD